MIDFPPVAFPVNAIVAFAVDPKDCPVGIPVEPIVGFCGTDVVVIEFEAVVASELPYPFVAVTVNVVDVPVGIFGTTIGEDAPVAEYPPDVDVTVKLEDNPPVVAGVNVTKADPLPYAMLVPTSVAVPIVGTTGITPN